MRFWPAFTWRKSQSPLWRISELLVYGEFAAIARAKFCQISHPTFKAFSSRKMSSTRTYTSNDIDQFYKRAIKLVEDAGRMIYKRSSSRTKSVEVKSSDIDLVTQTDNEVEILLTDGLSSCFPAHKFIGEETVATNNSIVNLTDAPTWIIDPIDGTMNFVHNFPHSCVSVALFINKQPEIGIVYNVLCDQLFTARRGKGAFLNDEPITVSGKDNLSEALVMMEFGTSKDPEKMKVVFENQQKLMPNVHGLRALGSAALDMAMVACGAADAYFEFGIHIWDIAAGELLITEAGGVIMDPSGGEIDRCSRRVLVASSQKVAEELSAKLTQFHPTPRDDHQ